MLPRIVKNPTVSLRINILFYLSIFAISVFIGFGVSHRYERYLEHKHINNNLKITAAISLLVHEIQLERGFSSLYTDKKNKKFKLKFDAQKQKVDKQIKNLLKISQNINKESIYIDMEKIKKTRKKVDNFSISHKEIINFYTNLNKDLLYHIFDQHVSKESILYYNFEFSKDLRGVQRAMIAHILENNQLSFDEKMYINDIIIKHNVHSDLFVNSVDKNVKDKYEGITSNQTQISIHKTINDILSKSKFSNFNKSADAWFEEMTKQINLLNKMDIKLSNKFIKKSYTQEKEAKYEFIIYLIISILIIAFLLIFKFFTTRSIRYTFRKLRASKKRVQKGLIEIHHLNQEIEDTQREVLFTMGAVVENRSKETINHVKRVAEYSKILALAYGLDENEAQLLKLASPMHDAGKAGIPDAILNKPARLTADEFELMKEHAVMGYDIFKSSNREILKTAAIVAYEHHEKYNGKGYPRGLKGENIHIYGRITAIADVFDALSSDRCYKKAWEDDKIFELFTKERGEHFDPVLTDLFFKNIDKFLEIRKKFKD